MINLTLIRFLGYQRILKLLIQWIWIVTIWNLKTGANFWRWKNFLSFKTFKNKALLKRNKKMKRKTKKFNLNDLNVSYFF